MRHLIAGMLEKGIPIETIADITGLSEDDIANQQT